MDAKLLHKYGNWVIPYAAHDVQIVKATAQSERNQNF
jgi:hypothetical protein